VDDCGEVGGMKKESKEVTKVAEMSDFEKTVKQAAENAVVKLITDGHWIVQAYEDRIRVPNNILSDAWKMVDLKMIKEGIAAKLNEKLVEHIMTSIATEISNDIKKVLSDTDHREAIRRVIHNNMEALTKPERTEP
jgi:precorrin isomerase